MRREAVWAAVLTAALALSASAPAWADSLTMEDLGRDGGLVVDQPPTRLGGPGSDTAFYYPAPPYEAWQQVADNILLDNAALIRRITWWGFYGSSVGGNHEPPTGAETMRIRFYDARAGDGLPGAILYEESYLNPSRTATGEIISVGGLPDEYIYEVDLATPVLLDAQIPYWLEIVQVGDIDSHYRWESGFGLQDGLAYINSNVPEWTFGASGSLAMQLSTIPEPASAALVLLGVGLLYTRSPGRRCRG